MISCLMLSILAYLNPDSQHSADLFNPSFLLSRPDYPAVSGSRASGTFYGQMALLTRTLPLDVLEGREQSR